MNDGLKKLFLRFIKEYDIINHYPEFKRLISSGEINKNLCSYSVFDEMIRWRGTKDGWYFWYLVQLRYAYMYYTYSSNKEDLKDYNRECKKYLARLTCFLIDEMGENEDGSTELMDSIRKTRDSINNFMFKDITNVFLKKRS